MIVTPADGPIGADVCGVDVQAGVDDATFDAILAALHRHAVIVLRKQRLSPAGQVAFARRFGEIRASFYNRYAVPGVPELSVVSNIKVDGVHVGIADAGMLWHTDASYLPRPDLYTLLYGIQIPVRDGTPLGATWFTSTADAYDALPANLRARIDALRASHSFADHLRKKQAAGNLTRAVDPAQTAAFPDVLHPVVRTHPVTGRKCLFVTQGHTRSIEVLAAPDSDALLHMLWQHVQQDRFQYRHRWQPGDLLIWDNCAVQHLAIFDYGEIPRRLHRVGIVGPAPA
jgi:taurine dioxygenase